ncbi:hypothetical protein C8Q80DRAFT_1094468 [Daedaleopsis nitida]|nr:hypothetical protein C8Q80DRAFT_1094468 [Daedaleopsis nitida]
MPGKHVHFVDLDVPSTPSSTFSSSTLSSTSSGPMTPPTVWYSPLPHTKSSPYTPAATMPVHLHPLLARTPGHGSPLHWDVSSPADNARPQLRGLPAQLTDALVAEPATNPPLPSLAIICDYLPWTLTVTPTPHALWSAPYVTLGDVLHALFRALRLGVTDPELAVLEPALQDRVRDAYVRRYRRVAGAREREAEKAKYIKRVDFLRDHTAFLGLSCVPGGLPAKGLAPGTVWALHVARP